MLLLIQVITNLPRCCVHARREGEIELTRPPCCMCAPLTRNAGKPSSDHCGPVSETDHRSFKLTKLNFGVLTTNFTKYVRVCDERISLTHQKKAERTKLVDCLWHLTSSTQTRQRRMLRHQRRNSAPTRVVHDKSFSEWTYSGSYVGSIKGLPRGIELDELSHPLLVPRLKGNW